MDWVTELVGLVGSTLILVSMLSKTSTYKGGLTLRALNLAGSIVFVIYGAMLPALSTMLFNIVAIVVNIYYLAKLKEHYKE